jgi:hypothetical protein
VYLILGSNTFTYRTTIVLVSGLDVASTGSQGSDMECVIYSLGFPFGDALTKRFLIKPSLNR